MTRRGSKPGSSSFAALCAVDPASASTWLGGLRRHGRNASNVLHFPVDRKISVIFTPFIHLSLGVRRFGTRFLGKARSIASLGKKQRSSRAWCPGRRDLEIRPP